MGIFKENLDTMQTQIMSNEMANKQSVVMNEVSKNLTKEKEQDKVLKLKGLENVSADQLKEIEADKDMLSQESRDAYATDRAIRHQAEKKSADAVKLKKMLGDLDTSSKAFQALLQSDEGIQMINSLRESNPDFTEEDLLKIDTLEKQAPMIYERLLKLEHATSVLKGNKDSQKELYNFAKGERKQALNEWEHVQKMGERMAGNSAGNPDAE